MAAFLSLFFGVLALAGSFYIFRKVWIK